MATTAARSGARPISAVKGSNFEPKRIRKARRKLMVRGALGNVIADAKMAKEDRQEFYRNLRRIKLQRRQLAKEMAVLAGMTQGLIGSVQHIANRYPDFTATSLDEARETAKAAHASVSVAADEFQMFARVRVYYVRSL
ncbi:hypothetical protein [Streptosporangium sp. NBC_01469]|uniref:hypothetical protein n=1 Tax=Streptosporangium sp. NBC_01469 TaxID=2903898 RepID=UPI002E2AD4CC|nr:hypothetical protein [Streptosporangium sp. NBC_01469]